jgi:hypothetical protein
MLGHVTLETTPGVPGEFQGSSGDTIHGEFRGHQGVPGTPYITIEGKQAEIKGSGFAST